MRYQINLTDLLDIIKKEKWILLLGTSIVTLFIVLGSILFITPKYTSSAQLIGGIDSKNQSEVNANILSITTYKDFAKSTVVLGTVMNELEEDDISLEQLKKSIEVKQSPDSQVFTIQATSESSRKAVRLADKTSQVFQEKAREILKNDTITIVSPAGNDTQKISPNLKISFISGLIIGISITLIIVLVKDVFNGTVKNERYIEEIYNIVPLGSLEKITVKEATRIGNLRLEQSIHLRRRK
ncbi:tyrosine protein kinase [Enterococcus florum]|uniref:Capsular polysaccharide biosynthesis protein CpsC n=1 Tax=Enterococcus florum TaxID=2480627 RepID=A0A4P5PEP2_9ENTE|nr:Wzz/FepE/Etk N-terminal domain-containing protein [Enterococcus florum]GCF95134.1 tyrosine protein kinase [Enterococcus florum]